MIVAKKTLIAFICATPALVLSAPAQSNPCANPSDPRIVVIAESTAPDASESTLYAHKREVEIRLRDAFAKKLSFACILTDWKAVDDPKNFPALKGTPLFEISAMPSVVNSTVAAIAVQISFIEGPFVEDHFAPQVFPVLIEPGDSNFDSKAGEITRNWKAMTDALTRHE